MKTLIAGSLLLAAAFTLIACGPSSNDNKTITEQTKFCIENKMDTKLKESFGSYHVVCVPPEMDPKDLLAFYQWKYAQAQAEENSFESKVKRTE